MKLSLKAKTLLSVGLFLLIFVALLLVATFLDLQISRIMTKGILPEGAYYATDFFGVMLEMVGCLPIYLFIAFAFCLLFWGSLRILGDKNKAFAIVCAVVCAIAVVAACWYAVHDVLKYIYRHVASAVNEAGGSIGNVWGNNIAAIDGLRHSAALYGVEIVLGALIAVPAIFATKLLSKDAIVKLIKLAVAAGIAFAVANLIVHIVKTPIGRMRFRAINSTVGQGLIDQKQALGYTPWYIINGQPTDGALKGFETLYGVDDAFKSFPSGHTCSAGTVYALIMLPDLFDFKNKKGAKLACWIVPILYTALVAISRIMVGAHYMSDVLIGGTLAFACVMIMREIFIVKGKHFFAVFCKRGTDRAQKAVENIENDATTCECANSAEHSDGVQIAVAAVDETSDAFQTEEENALYKNANNDSTSN